MASEAAWVADGFRLRGAFPGRTVFGEGPTLVVSVPEPGPLPGLAAGWHELFDTDPPPIRPGEPGLAAFWLPLAEAALGRLGLPVPVDEPLPPRPVLRPASDGLLVIDRLALPQAQRLVEAMAQFARILAGHARALALPVLLDAARRGLRPGPAQGLPPAAAWVTRAGRAAGLRVRWDRTTPGALRLGEGARSVGLRLSETSRMTLFAQRIATDKRILQRLLAEHGLPAIPQLTIQRESALPEALARIGYPCVIKPVWSARARGVTVDLRDEAAARAAFARAKAVSEEVLVERFVAGEDYRLLVVNGTCLAAVWRRRPGLIANGRDTIESQMTALNQGRKAATADPDRLELKPIRRDEDVDFILERQGLAPGSVPPAGRWVQLRSSAGWSQGSELIDVTGRLHPDLTALATHAAALVGLDVAGVDLLTPDLTQSWRTTPAALCEINSLPALGLHNQGSAAANDAVARRFLLAAFGPLDALAMPHDLALFATPEARDVGLAALAGQKDRTGLGLVAGPCLVLPDPGTRVETESNVAAVTLAEASPLVDRLVSLATVAEIDRWGLPACRYRHVVLAEAIPAAQRAALSALAGRPAEPIAVVSDPAEALGRSMG